MQHINKLTEEEVDIEFEKLLRERMTSNQFWQWVASWQEPEEIIDRSKDWDIEDKRDTLLEFATLPMFTNLYLTKEELQTIGDSLVNAPQANALDILEKVNNLLNE